LKATCPHNCPHGNTEFSIVSNEKTIRSGVENNYYGEDNNYAVCEYCGEMFTGTVREIMKSLRTHRALLWVRAHSNEQFGGAVN